MALASLPGVGPGTLREWLDRDAPSAVWQREGTGTETDVGRGWELHARLGISILLPEHPDYPPRLVADPEPPAVVFCLGDPTALSGSTPTVAIVGTRSPTRYGLGVAAQLGTELSAAGVSVVSGLALGIDGAAHEGACARRRRAARRGRGRGVGRALSETPRPAVEASGGAGCRCVRVPGRRRYREVALPRSKPLDGRLERRGRCGREPSRRRCSVHRRGRPGAERPGGRRPGVHSKCGLRGHQCNAGGRSVPRLLNRRSAGEPRARGARTYPSTFGVRWRRERPTPARTAPCSTPSLTTQRRWTTCSTGRSSG